MAGTPAEETADAVDSGIDGGAGEAAADKLGADYAEFVSREVDDRLKAIDSTEGAERLAHILGLVRLAAVNPSVVRGRVLSVLTDSLRDGHPSDVAINRVIDIAFNAINPLRD